MGIEINLLENYPKTKRDTKARLQSKKKIDIEKAREFGKEFFDGSRDQGYGGFTYNPRFWQPVIPSFKKFYNLNQKSSVLDVGCAKGFMLHDFITLIPGIKVAGIDISEYAIKESMRSIKNNVDVGNACNLNFEDNSFDLVISITTVHNLDKAECIRALKEIQRVSINNSFITVDAYSNEFEKKQMFSWNLTAKTILHVDDWLSLFHKAGYKGDYYWFKP